MIKKHAIIYSALAHILLAALFLILKMEREEVDESPVYLEYVFTEKPKIIKEKEPEKPPPVTNLSQPLPPIDLPNEIINETASAVIEPENSNDDIQSIVIMPKDTLTALDSVMRITPNLLTLRNFLMNRIPGSMPEDTSKKWKQIQQVGMDEYLNAMKYSDGFNNTRLQAKYNTGGISISLGEIFGLFSSGQDTVINFNSLPSGIRAYRDPEIYTENNRK